MKTVFLSSILALLFTLFTSNIDEHDLLYIIHSHHTTSHSHQEHHKSQGSASVTLRRMIVASHHNHFFSEKMILSNSRLLSVYFNNYKAAYKALISPFSLYNFTRLRI